MIPTMASDGKPAIEGAGSVPTEQDRRFGWWDMFVPPDQDPRFDGGFVGERATLIGYLRDRRPA